MVLKIRACCGTLICLLIRFVENSLIVPKNWEKAIVEAMNLTHFLESFAFDARTLKGGILYAI